MKNLKMKDIIIIILRFYYTMKYRVYNSATTILIVDSSSLCFFFKLKLKKLRFFIFAICSHFLIGKIIIIYGVQLLRNLNNDKKHTILHCIRI